MEAIQHSITPLVPQANDDIKRPNTDSLIPRALALAGIGAWSCELTDNALSWTPGIYELFGLSPLARVDRRDVVMLYDEESRDRMERLRANAIAQLAAFTFDAQIVRPDGVRRWMRVTADVVRQGLRPAQLYGLK